MNDRDSHMKVISIKVESVKIDTIFDPIRCNPYIVLERESNEGRMTSSNDND